MKTIQLLCLQKSNSRASGIIDKAVFSSNRVATVFRTIFLGAGHVRWIRLILR